MCAGWLHAAGTGRLKTLCTECKNKFTYKDTNCFNYFPVSARYPIKCSRKCEVTKSTLNAINKKLGGGDWRKLHAEKLHYLYFCPLVSG